ncbi:hypothetical protein K3495_g4204 [Podosphaera aphanis]|nr:hypothetical protein K3495_g4204 [Podosphaera aphanis]
MENIIHPTPLAFDRVMEGTAIKAHNSLLFRTPTEILTAVVSYLCNSKKDLESLALVNSDCRQLARSCQFRTVLLDSGHRSACLLGVLQRETVQRRQNRGRTRSLSLGACIRRIVVRSDGYWNELIGARPRKPGRSIHDLNEDAYDNDEEKVAQWNTFVEGLTYRLNEIYRPNVLFVISGLIHLESVDLDQVDWNQSLLNGLVACTPKHLSIRDLKAIDIVPVMDDSVVWPLETLSFHFNWDFQYLCRPHNSPLNASKSWETILRLCSDYLHILNPSHCVIRGMKAKEDLVSFSLRFPQLRQLYLSDGSFLSVPALESLILTSAHLVTLVIDYGTREIRDLLDCEGQIPSLKTLVLNLGYRDFPEDASLNFLKKNSQLEALGFTREGSAKILDRILLLLKKFSQLKKLSMIWKGAQVPDTALHILSSLASLETLHLSCGLQIGWRHEWIVSHDNIIKHLKPLRKLKHIALTRDVYSYIYQGRLLEYNSYQLLQSDSWDTHLRCMRENALKYAENFPQLELFHVGHISYEIARAKSRICLKTTEDEVFPWEKCMFGLLY